MLHFLHLLGSFPLAIGIIAQIIVVLSSLKDKDKKAATQGLILMGALGLILVSILLRPKSPTNPPADAIASVGALFLLTPGIQALLKLRGYDRKKQDEKAGGAATG